MIQNAARGTAVITAVACLILVVSLLVNLPLVAAASKVCASIGFLAVAIQSHALRSRYGQILLFGLVLSFFGDAFLIGDSRQAFLAGLGAFLLAHLAYVAAFIVHGVNLRWITVSALPIAAIAIFVSSWLAPHTPADLALPVQTYTIVISAMVVAALGTRGKGGSLLIVVGALMFFLSDLSVAALRLVQTDFPTYVWGLPLYYGGQLCLALSASQSRSH
jgi:uncharacterized membrane protein YhhN